MYNFDASSIIHAWDNYPISNPHFKSLWQWFADQISNKQFCISKIALEEVGHKLPECGKWLRNNLIEVYPLTPRSILTAQQIKTLLGIVEERYAKGVGENDLFIIAIAKETISTLVSEEARQNKLPSLKSNYKIPAVCEMPEVAVTCISFVELLK
ncbi:DUF4411 family protein, partial [Flavobacterium sp.]|uniref:DUF4411 family protein n=1 Tax=Flavobacterium sp. TaxID=239 RepID=UPI0025C0235C